MSNTFLFTAFSRDRVGIVADISRVIYENGYNLEDSSMTYLADEFAILLLLSAPPAVPEAEVMEKLTGECRRLEREKNITAYIRPASKERHEPRVATSPRAISVEGLDQAGIVYRVRQLSGRIRDKHPDAGIGSTAIAPERCGLVFHDHTCRYSGAAPVAAG